MSMIRKMILTSINFKNETIKGFRLIRNIQIASVALIVIFVSSRAQAIESPEGQWEGSYSCIQGQTALELSVMPADENHFNAFFHFHSLSSNPSVPEGCFTMKGAFDPTSRQLM